jgi:hypothetical protein
MDNMAKAAKALYIKDDLLRIWSDPPIRGSTTEDEIHIPSKRNQVIAANANESECQFSILNVSRPFT